MVPTQFFLFLVCLLNLNNVTIGLISSIYNKPIFTVIHNKNPFGRKYYEHYLNKNKTNVENDKFFVKKYPLTRPDFIEKIRNLNSKNITIQNNAILNSFNDTYNVDNENQDNENQNNENDENKPTLRIILNKSSFLKSLGINVEENEEKSDGFFDEDEETGRRRYYESTEKKSKNFEVIKNYNVFFKDVGGYENVKRELEQCVDILKNYQKYAKYNVRIPKGLILEGPPGTGKTLLAKALAGESQCSFISVSGSDFQEKYVGVGPTRIKELFGLAKKNVPCIIFIDEIDAVGRKRSSDGESSSNERDNTLNALLVELDGFKNNTGIFLVAATNRIDLLDNALVRPGRIDKKIYIGLPDSSTREAIINIHIRGKPYCDSIGLSELVEVTEGLSGAQIENLLNEAMLNALRLNNTQFCYKDFDYVMNKMVAGWQPIEHEFTSDIIDQIAIHEMGHAIVGFLSKYHSKMSKVVINLSSPKSPGYTVFKGSTSNIYTREALFEHLMILLSGRIAEEVFYNVSVTTGAINDFEEALKLAERMVVYYGMGSNIIYPSSSEKYKELIDNEVIELINNAYNFANIIITNCKELIYETSEMLKKDKILKAEKIEELINEKYKYILDLKIDFD
jgi:cell division protease FtsH